MTSDKLLGLAERVEKATEPSVLLDAQIYHDGLGLPQPAGDEPYCPRYTASLDAAMTLVPEGETAGFRVENHPELRRKSRAEVWIDEDADPVRAASATPALALTAAALKARASGETT
jgi:hypothetical protein